jgi:hypothetical protein
MPTDRMGPPPGASPPMRMTASWSGSISYRIQVCGTKIAQWRAPLGSPQPTDRQPPIRHQRCKSPVAVHHRSACSGVKALRNTSVASRQAAKLCYRFDPLTPSARSANLIAGDWTKNDFPPPNKEPAKPKNAYLTGKTPYRFESLYPSRRLLAGRHCRLAEPGRPTGSSPRILCFEHLKRTCTPAGRPRRKSRGRLRFERQYRD